MASNQVDSNGRVYGAATLQRPNKSTTIEFDGFISSLGENKGYNGVEYGTYTYNNPDGYDNPWAQYSYPAGTNNEAERVYPAAMWANVDKVCQETT